MWHSYNNNNAAVVVCYVFVVLSCILCDQILLLSSFLARAKQVAEPYVQQYIYSHTFTEYNIIVGVSVVVYNMYVVVVLLQEMV